MDDVRLSSRRGRALLTATALGSGMAFLDGTVVNVALPTIGRELDADLSALQWTVNAYTLTLAALILLGGALGDRLGRRRVFTLGVVWFTAASVLCALAPGVEVLIAARALQGVGGALLTPGALAILQTVVHEDDRARAIGAWAGLTGVSGIIGPLLGGWLLEFDWRWVFGINVPLAVLTVWLIRVSAPESRDENDSGQFDGQGAALGALALGASTYALIRVPEAGATPVVVGTAALSLVAAAAFLLRERRAPHPMVPLSLFSDRTFSVINIMTFVVYAGLSGIMFFLMLQLQVSLTWSPLAAGMATLPITLLMLFLSGRSAGLATRYGVRPPLVAGSLCGAAGVALLATVGPDDGYLSAVLPGVVLLGIGLTTLVPTLTATVMASAPQHLAGTASGVNNGISRAAGLIAVAALPALTGLAGESYADPDALTESFRAAMLICTGLLIGGALAAASITRRAVAAPAEEPAPSEAPEPAEVTLPAVATPAMAEHTDEEEVATSAPCPGPCMPPSYGR
ncbi:EmrB/QacA subfamily drug resistance transporter [Haloactinopolyspora alba]|uniref:EmrB/QacA subfamily drug resistance transporter n=1 Tax=Haloactinopolyspora alba TaxID=648780 RepID=A0A2P8E794_9ACTN|nr:MFS transporter [Haloactinopolyspora alba]PSL05343.1 EmrB/QacA subfamily drug resistance transporter [Haloactinopolyspora alba]